MVAHIGGYLQQLRLFPAKNEGPFADWNLRRRMKPWYRVHLCSSPSKMGPNALGQRSAPARLYFSSSMRSRAKAASSLGGSSRSPGRETIARCRNSAPTGPGRLLKPGFIPLKRHPSRVGGRSPFARGFEEAPCHGVVKGRGGPTLMDCRPMARGGDAGDSSGDPNSLGMQLRRGLFFPVRATR